MSLSFPQENLPAIRDKVTKGRIKCPKSCQCVLLGVSGEVRGAPDWALAADHPGFAKAHALSRLAGGSNEDLACKQVPMAVLGPRCLGPAAWCSADHLMTRAWLCLFQPLGLRSC